MIVRAKKWRKKIWIFDEVNAFFKCIINSPSKSLPSVNSSPYHKLKYSSNIYLPHVHIRQKRKILWQNFHLWLPKVIDAENAIFVTLFLLNIIILCMHASFWTSFLNHVILGLISRMQGLLFNISWNLLILDLWMLFFCSRDIT